MEVKELRLGNLVWQNYTDMVEEVDQRVTMISADRIHLEEVSIEPKWIQPIKLTEEWLLRMGCKAQQINSFKLNYWNKEMDFSIDVELNGHERLFYFLVCDQKRRKPLIYVHQLQNLYYALTGTELTIKP